MMLVVMPLPSTILRATPIYCAVSVVTNVSSCSARSTAAAVNQRIANRKRVRLGAAKLLTRTSAAGFEFMIEVGVRSCRAAPTLQGVEHRRLGGPHRIGDAPGRRPQSRGVSDQ